MDLDKVLAELLKERDLIDEAIANLERLSTGPRDTNGRPQSRAYPEKRQEKVRSAGGVFD
jgi:hypothetical protein